MKEQSATSANSRATGSVDRPSATLRKCYLSRHLLNGNDANGAPGTSVPGKRWPKLQTALFKEWGRDYAAVLAALKIQEIGDSKRKPYY